MTLHPDEDTQAMFDHLPAHRDCVAAPVADAAHHTKSLRLAGVPA